MLMTTLLSQGAVYLPALFATIASYYLASALAGVFTEHRHRGCEQC